MLFGFLYVVDDLNLTLFEIQSKKTKLTKSANKAKLTKKQSLIKEKKNEKDNQEKATRAKPISNRLGSNLLTLRMRTAPKPLAKMLSSMSLSQKQLVCDMGFGGLFGFSITKYNPKLGYYIVNSFDPIDMVIRTPKGDIRCDRDAVNRVLGISTSEGVVLNTLDYSQEYEDVWYKQFTDKGIPKSIVRASTIANNMSYKEADHLFKMNFLMVFYNTMIKCDSSGLLDCSVLRYIKSNTEVEKIDWCGELLTNLGASKVHWNPQKPKSKPYDGPYSFIYVSSFLLMLNLNA